MHERLNRVPTLLILKENKFMSISEIFKSLAADMAVNGLGTAATVYLANYAYHVKIGNAEIELGIRDSADPNASRPNPMEIRDKREMVIIIHKTVGQKPLTNCTIPEGLWEVMIKFLTLKGTDGDMSENLKKIKGFTADPRELFTALFPEGLCSYIKRKEIVQTRGVKD
jgi:hypothetical protein